MKLLTNRGKAALAFGLLSATLVVPARAGSAPLPDSCKLHPTKVLNPGCLPEATSDVREPGITLPDLRPDVEELFVLPEILLDPETRTFYEGPPLLYFDTHAQNIGFVPFDLRMDDPDALGTSTVSQCVSWTSELCRGRQVVGGFAWHEEHRHFHFQDFADYHLRKVTAAGEPDYAETGVVNASEKVSFCLIDSRQIRSEPVSPTRYTEPCTPVRQGISPGWADIYGTNLDGQQLSLGASPDGIYALVITLNPTHNALETDPTNNVVEVFFELSGGGRTATMIEKRWP